MERMTKVLAEAKKLAAKLERDVCGGPYANLVRPFAAGFEMLPSELNGLSDKLGGVLDLFGKPS